MLVEIYVVFQIIVFVLFFVSFFTRQEVIWAVTLVLAAVLMATSFTVEVSTYSYNSTVNAYMPTMEIHSAPYLMGLNLLLFVLGLIFCIFDIWEKYSPRIRGV